MHKKKQNNEFTYKVINYVVNSYYFKHNNKKNKQKEN